MTPAQDSVALWAEHQVISLLPQPVQVPVYGSSAWGRLPAGDPRRAAAIITAAEQWRRHQAEEERQARLMETDPEAWWRETTADATTYAAKRGHAIAARRTAAEQRAAEARATHRPPHTLTATPGWPPIAIPGRPGRYLTYSEARTAA